ncbi:MAG: AGE family epimerase/isomerase [Sphaerochaeta sp.]|nr:AGE family epimerase/isomerase [Sphaerochaeta sp.]
MSGASSREVLSHYAKKNSQQLERILHFWTSRTDDAAYGGYITCFDEAGAITSSEKNIWMNARQTWLFSTIAFDSGNTDFLALAESGYTFITEHAYAGNGQWHYLLDQDGSPRITTLSVLTDMFCLMALGAFERANGMDPSRCFLETASGVQAKLFGDQEMSLYPQTVGSDVIVHSPYMIAINAFSEVRTQLPAGEADGVIRFCISHIFEHLYSHERSLVYELRSTQRDNDISDELAVINPGHIFESMGFIAKEAKRLGMRREYNLSLDAIQKVFAVSYDPLHGGILHMLTMDGSLCEYKDWNEQRNLQATDKVWWTHAEALYALLLAYYERRNPEDLEHFSALFDWCENYFWDDAVGEWDMILERDGKKKLSLKGGLQKAAFHVPRSLYAMQAIFALLVGGKA